MASNSNVWGNHPYWQNKEKNKKDNKDKSVGAVLLQNKAEEKNETTSLQGYSSQSKTSNNDSFGSIGSQNERVDWGKMVDAVFKERKP